jgi:hypothetical protein
MDSLGDVAAIHRTAAAETRDVEFPRCTVLLGYSAVYRCAQSGNVVLDSAFGDLKTEAYFFIRLCPADEKQSLRFALRKLDQHKRTAW